ncbi:MAG: porin family protein [Methylobacter sp.]|nr:MAG: porin family protein [Methylobacter sp.]
MTGAMVSPQAVAGTKAQHHAEVAGVSSKVDALEAQLQAMQAEISRLRAEASRPHSSAESAKVQELDQWMTSVKSKPAKKDHHDNTLFFRGGYAHSNAQRGGTLDPTSLGALGNQNGLVNGPISDKDAWYFGAGFDFSLTDDVWGMMDNTQVLGELMFDYKEIGTRKQNGINATATGNGLGIGSLATVTGLPAANSETATVSQFTLAASPKIKFLKNKPFRPWLIPVGFEVNVISPPSDAITVLSPGMQFGLGADYRIWKDIFVGADARYHLTTGNIDGVRTDGVTAGGYIGLGF